MENLCSGCWQIYVFFCDIPESSIHLTMASLSSAVNDLVILTKDDIPGASLAGRTPSLENEEFQFLLWCHRDSLKGLKTNVLLV